MTKYVLNAFHKFQHPYPKRPQHVPHKWERPNYGARRKKVQRGKLIRDTTITENKINPKIGGGGYILCPGNQPNVTSGTCISHSIARKSNNTNRGFGTSIFRLLCNSSKWKTMLSRQICDTENPQWRILLSTTQGPHQIREKLLYEVTKLQKHQRKKRRCTHSIKNN